MDECKEVVILTFHYVLDVIKGTKSLKILKRVRNIFCPIPNKKTNEINGFHESKNLNFGLLDYEIVLTYTCLPALRTRIMAPSVL